MQAPRYPRDECLADVVGPGFVLCCCHRPRHLDLTCAKCIVKHLIPRRLA